jgi:DNA-binding response OmpR family regulator
MLDISDRYIMVVDDEPSISHMISMYYDKLGCRVKGVHDSSDMFKSLDKERPDIIILDLNLPGMDGFAICEELKKQDRFSSIPIIILSGRADHMDKVTCLDMGADDYVVKPFSPEELNARVKAVLRSQRPAIKDKMINIGDLVMMDLQKHEVTVEGKKVDLTSAEFSILECLSREKGEVFSRKRLLDYIWGEGKPVEERTIDFHVKNLREKLGKGRDMIKSVRGIGYKLEETP